MYCMQPYDDALKLILEQGVSRTNERTGIKTLSIFGIQSRYRIDEYFPIMTRRKVYPKAMFAELLWFLSGSTNNADLQALGTNIWTPWVSEDFEKQQGYVSGAFGPVYGFQLRHFGGFYGNGDKKQQVFDLEINSDGLTDPVRKIKNYGEGGFDQLAWMVNRIKTDPSCRRILFSLWDPNSISKSRLPPCHYTYQVLIDDEGRMTGIMTQRSCDFPIGVPQNISFYSLLTIMLAQQTGYTPYEFVHNTSDSHIYADQIEAVEEYLATPIIDCPKLKLNKAPDIFSYKMDDFELVNFKCGPKIEIPVAV